MKAINKILLNFLVCFAAMTSWAMADVYINVLAVNGTDAAKTSPIKFSLPGELTAADILDTAGLQLDYSVDDQDYYVYGDVSLKPKESKTFRIHVRDRWMVSAAEADDLKKQIEQGYETLGKPYNAQNAQTLKDRLDKKIDYILNLQANSADSVEKRISNYRSYAKEMQRIKNDALDVSYWRSDPAQVTTPKIIHLTIEVSNPTQALKHYTHHDFLPREVKPEDVVEPEDFEVRYDDIKQLAFLFKEEDLTAGQKKKYTIGIIDIWNIDQKDIDYLRSRAKYAFDFLKDSRYEDSAKVLMDRITSDLNDIEASQAVQRPIVDHISAYRANKDTYSDAEKNVEELEKLLAVYREDLEKSKVENILQKIQSLKGVGDVSKAMFNKKFQQSTAWNYIIWILIFVGLITFVNFIIWILRSKDKKVANGPPADKGKK